MSWKNYKNQYEINVLIKNIVYVNPELGYWTVSKISDWN